MTSGNFTSLQVNQIVIERDERQRRELTGVEELADSIAKNGLINPIVITRNNVLVAGERRLEAHLLLGFDSITVQYTDEIDKRQLHTLELEENIRRIDLDWRDKVEAIVRYHELQKEIEPEWSNEKTAENLHISGKHIGRYMLVKTMMDEGVEEVLSAPKFSVASNFAERKNERKKAVGLRNILSQPKPIDESSTPREDNGIANHTEEKPIKDKFYAIRCENFLTWPNNIQTTAFNLIHCDFPYGRTTGNKSGQSTAKTHGGYDDRPEIYFNLLNTLIKKQDNFISPSAHMLFWFAMDYYSETKEILTEAGWRVDPYPLIWNKTDNMGIIPDPNRGPRRIYETAFFCTRGDRKVVRPVGNAIGCATTKKYHMSEKAETMLEQFFRMLVDETTVMLDPTCGSGNAVKVSTKLGAKFSLGLELNPDYTESALINLSTEA